MNLLTYLQKMIKYSVTLLMSVGVILLVVSSFLMLSHAGNQLLITAAMRFEPRLSLQLKESSLFDKPLFNQISWIDAQTSIKIDELSYQFDWSCLFNKLCLTQLTIKHVDIILPEQVGSDTQPADAQAKPLVIDIPIEIDIAKIELADVKVRVGALALSLDNMRLKAKAFHKDIRIGSDIDGLLITLPNSPPNAVKIPSPVSSSPKALNLALTSLPALLTEAQLPRINLPINLTLESIKLSRFSILQNRATIFKLNKFQSAFTFKESLLTIDELQLDLPETQLSLLGHINFIDHYPLDLTLKGKVKKVQQLTPENLLENLHYKIIAKGTLSDLSNEIILSNILDVKIKSNLDLFAKNLPHTLDIQWQQLQWPLKGEKQVSSLKGQFTSKGSLNDNRITLLADYALADLPSGIVSLKTTASLQQLKVESLKIETLDGNIDFSGLLTWQDIIKWDGQLQINHIDLQQLKTDYDGQFSGIIKQQLALTLYENSPPTWTFLLPELLVEGQLLARPFNVSGKIAGDDKQGLHFKNVTLNNAENSVVVNGQLLVKNDLSLAVNITDLSHLLLQSSGKLSGDITLQGPLDSLHVAAHLQGESIAFKENSIKKMVLDATAIITEKPQLTLSLNASDIEVAKQEIDSVVVDISHQKTAQAFFKHRISLGLNSELISTDLLLYLTQRNNNILTQLNEAKLYLPEQTLTLDPPLDIIEEQGRIKLTPHCWHASTQAESDAGKLCIKAFNAGESGNMLVNIDSYLLTNINPFMPEKLRLAGKLSANADLKWLKGGNPLFDINVFSDDMRLKINTGLQSEKIIDYPIKELAINLHGTENKVKINTRVFSENLLDIDLKANVTPYQRIPKIESNVKINVPDFSLFLPLITKLDKLNGYLKTQLSISGNLKNPNVNGRIDIGKGAFRSPALPMKVNDLNAAIIVKNSSASLSAEFVSNVSKNTIGEKAAYLPLLSDTINLLDKSVKKVTSTIIDSQDKNQLGDRTEQLEVGKGFITGQFDWSNKFKGDLHFYANQLEIYDYGKIDLLISPNLQIAFNDRLKVTGDLLVNKGKVVIKEVPEGAISQSKDVIVVDIKKPAESKNIPIYIGLTVDMGNNFQLVAMGLDTFINGTLLINKRVDKDLTINGKLNFVKGSYRALGQQLVLQKSSLNFYGVPESPYIKIEAIRDPSKVEDNVTAGVRVTGIPDELELVIFSDPAMAQQEALSYLTRGRSLNSSSDSSTMANMLIDLAAGQSDGLMNSIGEEVGIKDLSLSSSGSGDNQSVGIRGKIAPGVEISYGVGVFENFSIFAVRYELFKRFYIEASSSIDQAVDAYYEFDWE